MSDKLVQIATLTDLDRFLGKTPLLLHHAVETLAQAGYVTDGIQHYLAHGPVDGKTSGWGEGQRYYVSRVVGPHKIRIEPSSDHRVALREFGSVLQEYVKRNEPPYVILAHPKSAAKIKRILLQAGLDYKDLEKRLA